jgi:hypothetical protein
MPLRCVARGVRSVLASKTTCAYYNKIFSWMCTVALPYCIQLTLIFNTCILMLTCHHHQKQVHSMNETELIQLKLKCIKSKFFKPKWQEQTLQNRQRCISHTWHSLSVIWITLLIPGSSIRAHSVCPSTSKNAAPTRKIPMKFYIWVFFKHVKKIHVSLKSYKNNRHFTYRPIYTYDNILLSSS